jgi:cation transport ATPase
MNDSPDDSSSNGVANLRNALARPKDQRLREFKYRFAQSVIFGLPVIALQYFGHSLGGTPQEADRWIAILQALLCSWIVYVAAAGMLFEGIVLLPHVLRVDFIIAVIVVLLWFFSLLSTLAIFVRAHPLDWPRLFHWVVFILTAWCGLRWWQIAHSRWPDLARNV